MNTNETLSPESQNGRRTFDEVVNVLVGKPFLRGGRGPFHYDCFGVFLALARAEGFDLVDPFTDDGVDPTDYRTFYRNFNRIPKRPPFKRLDVLYSKQGTTPHIATVLDGKFVLDTSRHTGAIRRPIRRVHIDEVFRLKCKR